MDNPQSNLQMARGKLRLALEVALREVKDTAATPATLAQAMTSLAQAQQAYNQAILHIPIRIMTDGVTEPIDPE